jgi:sortase A
VDLPVRAPLGAPDPQTQKITELLALAERCHRLADRARASPGAQALSGSGALGSFEGRIAALEQQLIAQRAEAISVRAERDALATQLTSAMAVPAPGPAPVPQQVLDEAKPIRGRRLLVWLAILGLIVGILTVVDAFMTMVFQEPISSFFQARAQSAASKKLDVEETAYARDGNRKGETNAQRNARLALLLDHRTHAAQQMGRVTIPAIGLKTVMFEGDGEGSLKKGAAHYEDTKMPGQPGTVGIAGHRTTFGAPFRHINDLKPGDRIIVRMPYAKYTYLVEGTKIVSPDARRAVLRSSTRARAAVPGGIPTTQKVVLTACHPIGSAAQRIVVTGRLYKTDTIKKA